MLAQRCRRWATIAAMLSQFRAYCDTAVKVACTEYAYTISKSDIVKLRLGIKHVNPKESNSRKG